MMTIQLVANAFKSTLIVRLQSSQIFLLKKFGYHKMTKWYQNGEQQGKGLEKREIEIKLDL